MWLSKLLNRTRGVTGSLVRAERKRKLLLSKDGVLLKVHPLLGGHPSVVVELRRVVLALAERTLQNVKKQPPTPPVQSKSWLAATGCGRRLAADALCDGREPLGKGPRSLDGDVGPSVGGDELAFLVHHNQCGDARDAKHLL